MRITGCFERVAIWHTAGPWHPDIGVEEYPSLSRHDQKALFNEIRAQGGPEVLSNVYHPDNWGSRDPALDHHYIARGHDGTIHGVLRAQRDYKTMEPKRSNGYRNIWVKDVYTGDDAPKGTGTALMQAAAHRAMRDGADFSVSNVVPHASGFYHSLGGTRQPNYSSFEWAPEDRDALAMGTPNKKSVTPMSGTWRANPTYIPGGSFAENNTLMDPVMPPGADDPVGYGETYVDPATRKRHT